MHRMTIEYAEPADPEAFETRYREAHVPLVKAVPGLVRFTISHPRGMGGEAPYMVAELWFADADSFTGALKSPEMAAAGAHAQGLDARMVMFSGEVVEAS